MSIHSLDNEIYLTETLPSVFRDAFTSVNTVYTREGGLVRETESTTSQNIYTMMGEAPEMIPWEGDRQIKQMDGYEQIVINRKFENTVEVDNDDLEDRSRVASITDYVAAMGAAAAKHPDEMIWDFIENAATTQNGWDGVPLFSAAHPSRHGGSTQSNQDTGGAGPNWYLIDNTQILKWCILQTRKAPVFQRISPNEPGNVHGFMRDAHLMGADERRAVAPGHWYYIYRSNQALNSSFYTAAREAMQSIKTPRGKPALAIPSVLMVPVALEQEAMDLIAAQRNASGASNTLSGSAAVVVNPYLANS